MQLDLTFVAELTTLHKKLSTPWSSHLLLPLLEKDNFVKELIVYFPKYEKKIKYRILIALMTLSTAKLRSQSQMILRLLEAAKEDGSQNDPWIPVLTGLVHQQLFPNRNNESIEQEFIATLEQTSEKLIHNLLTNARENIKDMKEWEEQSIYFLPLQYQFMTRRALQQTNIASIQPLLSMPSSSPPPTTTKATTEATTTEVTTALPRSMTMISTAAGDVLQCTNEHFTFRAKIPDFLSRGMFQPSSNRINNNNGNSELFSSNAKTTTTTSTSTSTSAKPSIASVNNNNNNKTSLDLSSKITASNSQGSSGTSNNNTPLKAKYGLNNNNNNSSMFRSSTTTSSSSSSLLFRPRVGTLPRESEGTVKTMSFEELKKLQASNNNKMPDIKLTITSTSNHSNSNSNADNTTTTTTTTTGAAPTTKGKRKNSNNGNHEENEGNLLKKSNNNNNADD